jgi:hypothetical protein
MLSPLNQPLPKWDVKGWSSPMVDFKFTTASDFDRTYETTSVKVDIPEVKKAATFYVANMRRVWLLYFSGTTAFAHGTLWGKFVEIATRELTNQDDPDLAEFALQLRIRDRAKELFAKESASHRMNPSLLERFGELSLINFDAFTAAAGEAGQDVFRAIFTSMVIMAWSSYETLCGDLWIAAVDNRKSLAERVISVQPDSGGKTEPKAQESKKFDISDLATFDYDLRTKLGRFLKHTERVKFDRLQQIEKSYEWAFQEAIYHATRDNPHRKKLRALELTRNLWVHRAGLVDERLKRDWSSSGIKDIHLPPLGSELVIDGSLAKDLIDSAIRSADTLIKSVDDWLCNNSD